MRQLQMIWYLKTLFSFLTFLFVGLMIQSCCENYYEIVGNGEILIYEDMDDPQNGSDTINGSFELVAAWDVERVGMLQDFQLFPSAYATSCEDIVKNDLLMDRLELSLDGPFNNNGQTIEANTNLIGLDELKIISGFLPGQVGVHFTPQFLQKAEFEKGDHIFTIKAETSDGLNLENSVEVFMDLE